MSINIILNIPAADSPDDVMDVFVDYTVNMPSHGIMPASSKANGNTKSLVHCEVQGASYQQILDVTTAQRPVWQIFAAQESHNETVYEELNTNVWGHLPDRNGIQQTEIHQFQGHAPWPTR